ncbi:membrane-spanning 4-domains subfamily A member 3 [Orycteropus afer afer]|uniref:Membrane-spanning 4-domains subfamily A member 3 n=1 Tax=Orycteropus afer afer TaxID=1230840 RepID=A0A8B7B384_ORYAF|nr:membrane-spanning 4-domains subfamily A member 3 [Orycteropus afer afer]
MKAIQILNGAMILALGVYLGSLQHLAHLFRHMFFFIFYTGYPLWGAVFMERSFEMNVSSAVIAFVGIILLSVNLAFNNQAFKNCQYSQSSDLCTLMGASSTGLLSLMLILTWLELCITMSISAKWCKANCCKSRVPPPAYLLLPHRAESTLWK